MAGEIDIFLLEKKAGKEFSNRLKRNLLSSIKSKTNKGTGLASRSTVKPVFKNELLDRITISTPYYIYPILHVGFEGSKKNGVNTRLKAREFLVDAIENGRLVEDLADVIGSSRAESIVSRIDFKLLGNG
ncbi:hypothetical protein LXD69_10255 [Flavobacterium sediminilitoris]|uniref:Uncharacterized protein n=1 Tax=Flavobacterium sediminilitoris TaxID=2024526 RepID=A0ABY4HKQ2_9FLAO|nr:MULTISPECIES: hypothetical protein [Flavobacterium]UOX32434.1 hypothetical protein LXD69_10255 [Flavobacterium sediminilitoris]